MNPCTPVPATWRMGSQDLDTWLKTMVIVFVPFPGVVGPLPIWLINGGGDTKVQGLQVLGFYGL